MARLTMIVSILLVLSLVLLSKVWSPVMGAVASPTTGRSSRLNNNEDDGGYRRKDRLESSSSHQTRLENTSPDQIPEQSQARLHFPNLTDPSSHDPNTSFFSSFSSTPSDADTSISGALFAELEELARIVDIAYCVGVAGTGIQRPFVCASRCADFPSWELVETWHTGPLLSDSCGYVALDHGERRIVVVFRGTYSLASTIVDLATVPQRYVPYPSEPGSDGAEGGVEGVEGEQWRGREDGGGHEEIPAVEWQRARGFRGFGIIQKILAWFKACSNKSNHEERTATTKKMETGTSNKVRTPRCDNCTVHSGFLTSWLNTRASIIPHLESLTSSPLTSSYTIHLVGHSLGGAVAALAALELSARGWHPIVTTFGEPRIGNAGLRRYVDEVFRLDPAPETETGPIDVETAKREGENGDGDGHKSRGRRRGYEASRFRRITHVDDPVPLLPPTEWTYRAHAGEIFIEKAPLSPLRGDVRHCRGDADPSCIGGGEHARRAAMGKVIVGAAVDVAGAAEEEAEDEDEAAAGSAKASEVAQDDDDHYDSAHATELDALDARWPLPARYRLWQLLFAHRDYFWRLGLCVPGGDPWNWDGDGVVGEDADADADADAKHEGGVE